MNVRFQSVLALGVGQLFPLSFIYVSVIYFSAVVVILWAGLGIYLAITGDLKLRRFLHFVSKAKPNRIFHIFKTK